MITTVGSFDRERQREFTLSVTATDQAEEPLIGICQITVLILDENDNDPKFENSRYQCKNYSCRLKEGFSFDGHPAAHPPQSLFKRQRGSNNQLSFICWSVPSQPSHKAFISFEMNLSLSKTGE